MNKVLTAEELIEAIIWDYNKNLMSVIEQEMIDVVIKKYKPVLEAYKNQSYVSDEEDLEPSKEQDSKSVATLACTSSNSIEQARNYALDCHLNTNHKYDGKPYSFHLQMVVDAANKYRHLIPDTSWNDVLSACWCHDVIEDCRQTYHDVKRATNETVAEIVYALTNEKGKTRKERANERYYSGIINTRYAVFVKVCDRLANVKYSVENNSSMAEKYKKEFTQFERLLNNGDYNEMFWGVAHLLNSDKNDERIATQGTPNQGDDAGIQNYPH